MFVSIVLQRYNDRTNIVFLFFNLFYTTMIDTNISLKAIMYLFISQSILFNNIFMPTAPITSVRIPMYIYIYIFFIPSNINDDHTLKSNMTFIRIRSSVDIKIILIKIADCLNQCSIALRNTPFSAILQHISICTTITDSIWLWE